MQQNSDLRLNYSDFSDRTDALAQKLGVRLVDLTDKLSMSADMIMGYRTGRYPITAKAWKKLHAAEDAAGLVAKHHDVVRYKPSGDVDVATSIAKLFELNPEELLRRANEMLADENIPLQRRVQFGAEILGLLEIKETPFDAAATNNETKP